MPDIDRGGLRECELKQKNNKEAACSKNSKDESVLDAEGNTRRDCG